MIRASCVLLVFTATLTASVTYRVRLDAAAAGRIVEMDAEQYVAGVVRGEAGTFHNQEALKAMAVAARTYAAHFHSRHASAGFDFCSTTHCQRLILKPDHDRYWEAAHVTRGELLWFRSQPALAVYTQNCGGRSESVTSVWPSEQAFYLRMHGDPFCRTNSHASWVWQTSLSELGRALQQAGLRVPSALQQVTILRRTGSNRAATLSLIGERETKIIDARTFRFALGRTLGWNTIRSELFTVKTVAGQVRFQGSGAGHGLGLCQDGADEMAATGKSYREILAFYYPGTSLARLANDVHWFSAHGAGMTVFAKTGALASAILQVSLRNSAEIRSQYKFRAALPVSIYVYPDMDSFRNSTGEPGWVAAHTVGTRIELQPYTVLQQRGGFEPILKHELLHATIESVAAPGLPIWYREGLAQYLTGSQQMSAREPLLSDESLVTRRDSWIQTRNADRAAGERVALLRRRYGMAELLRWVSAGLPAAVARSSTSSSPANSR